VVAIKDYLDKVATPMDLGTMARKAREGAYASLKEWCADFALIVANCRAYNPPGSEHAAAAGKLEAFFAGLRSQPVWLVAEKSSPGAAS
jgi:hypothetical protein